MPRGTPEGATRLSQGEKEGRGSFLRLTAKTIGVGVGIEALTQLAPLQTAEAATNDQKNRRAGTSTQSALKQETELTPTNSKKKQVAEDILPPIPDVVLYVGGVIAAVAGIVALANRGERRGRGQPSDLLQMWEQEQNAQKQKQRRQTQEDIRHREEFKREIRQRKLERQAKEAEQQRQNALRSQRLIERGKETCIQLEQELQSTPLSQYVEDIRKVIWKNNYVRISLTPVSSPGVTISESGSQIVQNRSQVGWKFSYTYKDAINNKEETVQHALSFGIGYFTDKSQIIQEAQGLVSDEDLRKGVKALFVESTELFLPRPHKEELKGQKNIIIPLAYPGVWQAFDTFLIEQLKEFSPNRIIPDAKLRKEHYDAEGRARAKEEKREPHRPPHWDRGGR